VTSPPAAVFLAVAVLLAVAASSGARAFHSLDCGPYRAVVTDPKTGVARCGAFSPEAQEQLLRSKRLLQAQEQRTRDLQLRQKQRAKAQALITSRERDAQQQRARRQAVDQRQPALDQSRALRRQEALLRTEPDETRRREELRENERERRLRLLEQQVELPRTDLLDDQRLLARRLHGGLAAP